MPGGMLVFELYSLPADAADASYTEEGSMPLTLTLTLTLTAT